MSKVRWGVVSAANIAHTFANDIAFVDNAELAAVAARNLDSAQEFANRHGIPSAYEGYESLFADPDIDAVYIATPHALHLDHATAALSAGKAVLCEKPLTISASECETLIETARSTETYLMEAMWTWFLPAVVEARRWVDEGRIGELVNVRAEFGFSTPYDADSRLYAADLGGGCLLEIGIYPVAIARFFLGRAPTGINVTSHHAPNGVEDDVVALLDYGGETASLHSSYRARLHNHAYVVGTDAYIENPYFWRAEQCHLWADEERVDTFVDNRRGTGFEFEIAAASQDILESRLESEVVPHSASLAFQRDMDAIRARFGA